MIDLLNNIWAVLLDTAFWLLIGLLAAGLIKTYIPEDAMKRWVGGKGIGAISRAALFGAPLPLCSCGVLPAAIGLHRAGASKEATVSFLISTPETSVDSVAVTYALMGPVMAIYRPIAALVSAVVTGLLTTLIKDEVKIAERSEIEPSACCKKTESSIPSETADDDSVGSTFDAGERIDPRAIRPFGANKTAVDETVPPVFNANDTHLDASVDPKSGVKFNANDTSIDAHAKNAFNANDTVVEKSVAKACCSSKKEEPAQVIKSCCSSKKEEPVTKSCCSSESSSDENTKTDKSSGRLFQSIKYASAELLDDISKWLAIGIVLAGIMLTFIPNDWFAQWGSGLNAMLIMLVVGVPLYICAVASTPVAAGLLIAGVSPGAVLVFLLVGPATNIASFALIKQELGMKVTIVYLLGISLVSLTMGLLLELLLDVQGWTIEASLGEAHSMLPMWLAVSSAVLLLFLAIKPLRKAVLPQLG